MNLEHLSKGQIHEELAFMTEKAKRDMIAWKSHWLRSVNQETGGTFCVLCVTLFFPPRSQFLRSISQ